MNPASHLPLALNTAMKISAALLVTAALAASAFSQAIPRPPGTAAKDQILLEMKLIEAADGAFGVSLEKGRDSSRFLTPEQFVVELEKVGRNKGATVVSSPNITTRDGQRCTIEVGDPAAKPKSGYSVNVLPRIASEGIILEILFKYTRPAAAEKNDEGLVATLATSVTVKEGSTVLLGGTGTTDGRRMVLAVTASRISAPPPAPE